MEFTQGTPPTRLKGKNGKLAKLEKEVVEAIKNLPVGAYWEYSPVSPGSYLKEWRKKYANGNIDISHCNKTKTLYIWNRLG